MQAVVASLFNMEIDEVPNFISLGRNWFDEIRTFFHERGYEYKGTLFNKNFSRLVNPTSSCFEEEKWYEKACFTEKKLEEEGGVDGLFFGVVLSPKYFNYKDGVEAHTHAVVIDSNYNIVHDVSPSYDSIIKYPLADLLGYNGVLYAYNFKKADWA